MCVLSGISPSARAYITIRTIISQCLSLRAGLGAISLLVEIVDSASNVLTGEEFNATAVLVTAIAEPVFLRIAGDT